MFEIAFQDVVKNRLGKPNEQNMNPDPIRKCIQSNIR